MRHLDFESMYRTYLFIYVAIIATLSAHTKKYLLQVMEASDKTLPVKY